MGFFARMFGTDPESRVARARKLVERGDFDEARRTVEELDHPEAVEILATALTHLVDLNLEEAQARAESGDHEGAKEHMGLATRFGARPEQLRAVRRFARERAAEDAAAQAARAAAEIIAPEGGDPLWSLPPDDPRLRYALLLESWPESLRERLAALGPGYAQAVMLLEDGQAGPAREALSAFVEGEPAARYDRARAALAAGQVVAAASDLATFGAAVGHLRIGSTHTAVLLAQLLAQTGRGEDALGVIEAELERAPDLALEGTRASILEALGRLDDAIAAAEELLKKAPKDQGLFRLLARARIKKGDRPGAVGALEGSLASTCSSPGKCGNQPYDVTAARMLALLYLEDGVQAERVDQLIGKIRAHAQEPVWEDGYIAALQVRNGGDTERSARMGEQILQTMSHEDPRREAVRRNLSALPIAG
jgi:tetratricopeptide (TPR) repeat protein